MDKNKNIKKFIKKYSSGYKLINKAIKLLPDEVYDFRPELPDAWSIKEHIIHLVESEVNFYLRVKFSIAEPGKDALVIDEQKWQKSFSLVNESVKDYLVLFKLLRKIISGIFASLDISRFEEYHLIHPKLGKFTLAKMVEVYSSHPYFHIEYIERNINLFNESRNK